MNLFAHRTATPALTPVSYQCPHCDATHVSYSARREHLRLAHGETVAPALDAVDAAALFVAGERLAKQRAGRQP